MEIRTYLTTESYSEEESVQDSIFIYIDVLRASTTVCAALYAGAKEVIPVESMDKAIELHQNLSKETSILAGERDGIKPLGFLLGNSPAEFTADIVKDKTIVLTTTNGTKAFQKAKNGKHRIVASFVNLSIVVSNVRKILDEEEIKFCNIICAGNNGCFSFEDCLCAGAIITRLSASIQDLTMNDGAIASKDIYGLHKENLNGFIKSCEHSKVLTDLGLENDINEAITIDKYPVLPKISGNGIKLSAVNLLEGDNND